MTQPLKRKAALARKLRKALTEPEYLLWERLKLRLDDGLVFRRQYPMGAYVLDFYCFKARLVIEVDGAHHGEDEQAEHDRRRDTWLTNQGLMVYRVPAAHVYADVNGVADGLRLLASELASEK